VLLAGAAERAATMRQGLPGELLPPGSTGSRSPRGSRRAEYAPRATLPSRRSAWRRRPPGWQPRCGRTCRSCSTTPAGWCAALPAAACREPHARGGCRLLSRCCSKPPLPPCPCSSCWGAEAQAAGGGRPGACPRASSEVGAGPTPRRRCASRCRSRAAPRRCAGCGASRRRSRRRRGRCRWCTSAAGAPLQRTPRAPRRRSGGWRAGAQWRVGGRSHSCGPRPCAALRRRCACPKASRPAAALRGY
jgi:hypothetical protein